MNETKISVISLTFGYVESSRTAKLIFQSEIPLPSKTAALHSLTEYLWQKFLIDYEIGKNKNIDLEDWETFIYRLYTSDADSYGEHDCAENPYGWSPWTFDFSTSKDQVLIIDENGAEMLTFALVEMHPERLDGFSNLLPDINNEDDYRVRNYRKLLAD